MYSTGDIDIYIREDKPSKELKSLNMPHVFEDIYTVKNLFNSK